MELKKDVDDSAEKFHLELENIGNKIDYEIKTNTLQLLRKGTGIIQK